MRAHYNLLGKDGLSELGLDLSDFADGLPGGFFVYEADGDERILFANRQMARIFGCESIGEFLDLVGGTFTGVVYHEDRLRVEDSIWSQINARGSDAITLRDHVTYRIQAKDGSLHFMDEYGRLVRNTARGDLFFVFVVDVSPMTGSAPKAGAKPTHEQVSAFTDELTLLPSMKFYHAHAVEFLAQAAAAGTRMADVYFDIDHFKAINYRLGYEAGDAVLHYTARILQEIFPSSLLARFSDDHFVLITKREGLEDRLEVVHARVKRILSSMPIELKAGIYELAANDTSIAFAHDRAKVACASIKGRFDQYYRFYDESLLVDETMRDYVLGYIEEAASKGWLCNYYQPVMRVATGLTCGMEALSRWKDPERGLLLPYQYVPFLEEARLIHILDRCVVEKACSDVKRALREVGVAVPVSLNFSPNGLALLDVPKLVEETVDHHDVPHDLVRIEITESSLTEDPELLRSVIARFHSKGFSVWMDDFGSGYSSLNLLKDYDFDVLKIDMEFLRGMEDNERSRTIVHSITKLSQSLGMQTLVEGVETEAQFEFLRAVGADKAQGYLFSQPIPYEDVVGDFFRRNPPETQGQP